MKSFLQHLYAGLAGLLTWSVAHAAEPCPGHPGPKHTGRDRGFAMTTYLQPGAATTSFNDINNKGDIAGDFVPEGPEFKVVGLLLDRRTSVPVEIPGYLTSLKSIGDGGEALGDATAPDFSDFQTFLRARHGTIRVVPADPEAHVSFPGAMNDKGTIVGSAFGPGEAWAYVLKHGVYTHYTAPASAQAIFFLGINNEDEVVGYWDEAPGQSHGFFFKRGQFTELVVPGADATYPSCLNDKGDIAGFYTAGAAVRGFLWSRGELSTFDYQDEGQTFILGINNHGQMVGRAGSAGLIITPEKNSKH